MSEKDEEYNRKEDNILYLMTAEKAIDQAIEKCMFSVLEMSKLASLANALKQARGELSATIKRMRE